MKTVIHLKTARVYGNNADMTPKVERTTVKLEDGDNFNKFVKHMHLKGYMKSEPPVVVKVLQKDEKGKYQEIDKTKWQNQVAQAVQENGVPAKVDYKAEYEKQKAQNAGIMERLEALEQIKPIEATLEVTKSSTLTDDINEVIDANNAQNKRDLLEVKAKELNITFRANIGDAKLLEKIQAVEPDFKL